MTPKHTVAAMLFGAAVVIAAWMFRYDAKDSGYGTSLVTDRWTGSVYRCGLIIDGVQGCRKQF